MGDEVLGIMPKTLCSVTKLPDDTIILREYDMRVTAKEVTTHFVLLC